MAHIPLTQVGKDTKKGSIIKSYGIVLFCIENYKPLFLLYQRRDSYEYADLIRGTYSSSEQFLKLVSSLCIIERTRISKYPFNRLWDDLWVSHNTKAYRRSYQNAKNKFEIYKTQLRECQISPKMHIEPSWGFPKGRKNPGESNMECALREFAEETGVTSSSINILDTKTFIEPYNGNDGLAYCTEYFIAKCDIPLKIQKIATPGRIRNVTVSNEAFEVKWLTLNEACLKLNPRRQNILKGIAHVIHTWYDGRG